MFAMVQPYIGPALLYGVLAVPVLFLVALSYIALQRRGAKSWKHIDAKTLKVGGSKKKLAAANEAGVDAIVIGAGLSALTTASTLAKAGYRCVVLEQHDVAGGATHTFEDGGFEFDVGLHYIGGNLHSWFSLLRKLWSTASDGQMEFTKLERDYDVCYNSSTGESIKMCDDFDENDKRILAKFKGVKGAAGALGLYRWYEFIAGALALVFFGLKALPPFVASLVWPLFRPIWLRFGAISVADTLRKSGMVGKLKGLGGVVTYLYGDYGVNPARAPFFLHALVRDHYRGGAFFPTGGSASIAKTLVQAITRRGGHVFVRCPVTEIIVEGGRAVGVRAKGVEVRAPVVVSSAGFRTTFGSQDTDGAHWKGKRSALLPPAVAKETRESLLKSTGPKLPADKVGGSLAMVYLFVGLDKSDENLDIRTANIWALKDYDHDAAFDNFDKLELAEGEMPNATDLPAVFIGSASAKDSDWPRRHPGKAAMTVLCPVKAEWFHAWRDSGKIKHRGEAYKAYKAKWKDLLLETLYKHYPKTKGHVVYADVGSPLTNDFYLGTWNGEVYGLDHNLDRYSSAEAVAALHPQTSIPGLYMTGQDTLNVGVASALIAGFITACRVSYLAAARGIMELIVS